MQLKFLASYRYLMALKQEIKERVRESRAQEKLGHLREEAERMLGMQFDLDEIIEPE